LLNTGRKVGFLVVGRAPRPGPKDMFPGLREGAPRLKGSCPPTPMPRFGRGRVGRDDREPGGDPTLEAASSEDIFICLNRAFKSSAVDDILKDYPKLQVIIGADFFIVLNLI